ncbi:MAG: hypothetical protein CMP08_10265 [Xanthomonadales bacterium]|nr:hypothetical protein [Xanthomonadales bacterium]|tara:strand:- start:1852 stop:2208 length:357 start_codon:yes stop_codon:yes gene_type:complete
MIMSKSDNNNRVLAVFVLVAMLMSTPLTAAAQDSLRDTPYAYDARTPSAGAMAFDAVIVRPLSLAATVGGLGLFVISLPFSVIGDNVNESGSRLVGEPGRYTFTRPLGEFEQAYNSDD